MTKIIIGASGGIGTELYKEYNPAIGTCNKTQIFGLDLYELDITNYNKVLNFIDVIKAKQIQLVICSGVNYNSFCHKSDADKWKQVIEVNLIGVYNVLRAFLPLMREQSYGRIVILSSVVGQKGIVGTSAYAASKAGLSGLIKAVAVENASKNILINTINLGYMETGMINEIPEEIQEKIIKSIPCGKLGSIESIIQTVEYLLKTDYITGTSIDLNGGIL